MSTYKTALLRCLISDFMKTKRLSVRTAHIAIPLCVVCAFLVYYAYAPWNPQGKIEVYFQVIGIGFPILIGLFSVILTEQELSAASYQEMLALPQRVPAFYSKLLLLITGGAFSILLTCILFGMGNIYILKQSVVPMPFYLLSAFILIVNSIVLYTFHLFLALRFNKGVSIIAGVSESLITALFLTGLGENIWYYMPCAWAPRFIMHLLILSKGMQIFDVKCVIAVSLCVISAIFGVLLFGIWAYRWEGQHTGD